MVRCLLLSFLFALLPLASHGGARRASSKAVAAAQDTPSGFLPGLINYFAGDGTTSGTYSDGSIPTNVSIVPGAIATDSNGNVYIASAASIYMVYAGGPIPATLANVTTGAATPVQPTAGSIYQVAGASGLTCYQDPDTTCGEGQRLNLAAFSSIAALAFDSAGDLFIVDAYDDSFSNAYTNVVREVEAQTSRVTTVAGTLNTPGGYSGDGGPANEATLNSPVSIALDSSGNVYINDYGNTVLRVVYSGSAAPPILAAEGITGTAAAPGTINTFAGGLNQYCSAPPTAGVPGAPGTCGDYGPATGGTVFFFGPNSLAVDPAGNIYVLDAFTNPSIPPEAAYLRVIYATGAVPPLLNLALNPTGGSATAPTPGYIYAVTGYDASVQAAPCTATPCGDGGLPADVQFGATTQYQAILLDSLGNVYVSDPGDAAVRKIDSSLIASTIAGELFNPATSSNSNVLPSPPGGPATSTQLSQGLVSISIPCSEPTPTACGAPINNLYISDIGYAYTALSGDVYEPGDLVWVVAPLLPQTIAFNPLEPVTYGVNSVALAATASSGLPVSYAIASTPANIAALNGSSLVISGAGSVQITATQAGNAQYAAATPMTQTLTIEKALLSVSVQNASTTVGQTPAYTPNYNGFIGSDTAANSLTGAPAYSPTAAAAASLPFGTYPVTISQGTLASANYSFTFVQGATLTITGNQIQTITFAQPPSITYGQTSTVALSATASSGLPVQYTVVSGPANNTNDPNGPVLAITGGGKVTVTASQGGNLQYEGVSKTVTFTVNPAPLTVTGPTVSQVYGTAINPGSFPAATITGFVGSDNSSLVAGSAQYSTATGSPNTGTYPITVGQGTLAVVPSATASYVLSNFVNGLLTITPASQTINLNPVPSSQVYGYAFSLTATATSGLPITFTLTGPGYFYNGIHITVPPNGNTVQVQPTGVGAITVTAVQAGNTNISAAPPVAQAFNIAQAPLNIGVAQTYQIEQGAPIPAFLPTLGVAKGGQPGGFVNGDSDIPSVITGAPVLTTNATQSSPPGSYTITPTQGTLAAANYYFVPVPETGGLVITPPGAFAIASSPSSLTIPSGLSAQATLTINPVTPYTDANGNPQQSFYQGTVTLTCGTVPANVTCSISPATFTFPGNQAGPNQLPFENVALGTVTISASGATVVGSAKRDDSIDRAAMMLVPGALAGLLLAFARKRAVRGSRVWGAVLFLALGAGLLGISSCGGSSKSLAAAPGTSTVMIEGSGTTVTGNGSVTAAFPLSVTIQ